MSTRNMLRASVVQTCSAGYSISDTLDKLDHFARIAQKDGASLAVFPEALWVLYLFFTQAIPATNSMNLL